MDLGDVVLDESGGLLLNRHGQAHPLRAQSMKVLRLLAARAGEVVSKDDLMAEVWGDLHVTDDSLTQCIADIRRALGDTGHQVVQTEPKQGYRLMPKPASAPAGQGRAPLARPRPAWLLALAVLVLAVLGGIAWMRRPAPGPVELPRIAVLPFADLSGEPRWKRRGQGLAREIGADLARSKGIVVIPAETAEAAPGEALAAAEVLGVRFVLDGTVQAEGWDLRITARLADTEASEVVWSDRWSRPAKDLFAVHDEIVGRIGGTLDATWTGMLARTVQAGSRGQRLRSLEAYELYLLGAEAKHRFTPEAFADAVVHLRRALEIDPGFLQAMVTLSLVHMWQADYAEDEAEAAALIRESFRLAEQAARTDPGDPNALVRLSNVRVLQGRRAEAWPLAARAVEIAPDNPDVLSVPAWTYFFADRGPAPRTWAERAILLNPGHPDWYNCGLAMTALFAGDLDTARQAGRQAPPLAETLVTLGAAEALAGNIEEARAWFGRFATETRHRNLSARYSQQDLGDDPAWAPLVEGARLAGFPVTAAEANQTARRP